MYVYIYIYIYRERYTYYIYIYICRERGRGRHRQTYIQRLLLRPMFFLGSARFCGSGSRPSLTHEGRNPQKEGTPPQDL